MGADDPGSKALTDRARKALGTADRMARQRGAAAVDTHHLLLALLEPESGVALEVIAEIGLDPALVRRAIDRLIPPGRAVAGAGRLVLTRDLEGTFDLAERAAEALGHEMVGTEHLLLGLLQQGKGAGAAVLDALGLTQADVRAALVLRLGEGLEGRLRGMRRRGRPPGGAPRGGSRSGA